MKVIKDTREDKKMRIVEAAARVFARNGFARSLVSDIAREADIGKGTVYEYFASKNELFFAVFEWFVEKMATAAQDGAADFSGSASRRLEGMVASSMNAGVDMENFFSLSMEFWAASGSSQMRVRFADAFRRAYENFRCTVVALIEEGKVRGEFKVDVDASAVAAGLVGSLDGVFLQAWFDRSFDPVATARSFTKWLVKGIKSEENVEETSMA